MAATTLLSLFPKPMRFSRSRRKTSAASSSNSMPPLLQNGMFNPAALIAQVYQFVGPSYPPGSRRAVELAVAEAISWLVTRAFWSPTRGSLRLASMCRRAARSA